MATASTCDSLKTPSYVELTVSIIILIGLLISYLPQHYRIISRRTSEGISPYFVLLGTTSATAGFANILTVHPLATPLAAAESWRRLNVLRACLALPSSEHSGCASLPSLSYSSSSFAIAKPMCLRMSLVERVPDGKRLSLWGACASFTDWL